MDKAWPKKEFAKNDFVESAHAKTANNNNIIEFLDLSDIDENQKNKLKHTLYSTGAPLNQIRPKTFSRNKYPPVQQHFNTKATPAQPQFQFAPPGPVPQRWPESSNSFYARPPSNTFINTPPPPTNNGAGPAPAAIYATYDNAKNNAKIVESDTRATPYYAGAGGQDKNNKWRGVNKKPPYAGLREDNFTTQSYSTQTKKDYKKYREAKESVPPPPLTMSPPSTTQQQHSTSTTNTSPSSSISSSNSNVLAHQQQAQAVPINYQQPIPYGSHPQGVYTMPIMPGNAMYMGAMQHGYMQGGVLPGQQMIAQPYMHNEMQRGDSSRDRDNQNNPDGNSSAARGVGRGRGRGRGASNNNTGQRREYQPRQPNQGQQAGGEYMQMVDPAFAQYYIPYNPYYHFGGPVPNATSGHVTGQPHMSHMNATATSSANAHNLTGAPLYIAPVPMYPHLYGFPPPGVMYHPMPPHMSQQAYEQQMSEDKEEGSNGPVQPPIIQQVWHHPHLWQQNNVGHQQIGIPKHIYHQQSPHQNDEDLEFQQQQANEYEEIHMHQMMENQQNYQMMENQQPQQENVGEDQQMDHDINNPAYHQQMQMEHVSPEHQGYIHYNNMKPNHMEEESQQEDYSDVNNIEQQNHHMVQQIEQQTQVQIVQVQNVMVNNVHEELVEKTAEMIIDGPEESSQPAEQYVEEKDNNISVNSLSSHANSATSPDSSSVVPNVSISFMEPEQKQPLKVVSSSVSPNTTGGPSHDNKQLMIKKQDKPPAWSHQTNKKQTASVSVSAIPSKDVHQPPAPFSNLIPSVSTNSSSSNVIVPKSTPVQVIQPQQPQDPQKNAAIDKKTEIQQQAQLAETIQKHQQQMVSTITSANENKREQQHQESQTIPQKPIEVMKVSPIVEPVQIIPPVQLIQQVQQPPQPMLWANLLKPAGQRSQPTHVPHPLQNHTQTAPETAKKINPPRDLQLGAQGGQQCNPATVSRPKSKSPPPTSVPGVLSYSAASAQGLPPPTSAHALPQPKKQPQRPAAVANKKFEPIDEWFIKMGEFLSKYQIDNSNISLMPRGLVNNACYCYLNAILQALIACPPFYHLMRAMPQTPAAFRSRSRAPVIDAMVELVHKYSPLPYRARQPHKGGRKDDVPDIQCDSAFEPAMIHKMLLGIRLSKPTLFPIEGRQEDAEEFFCTVLNCLNEEMADLMKFFKDPTAAREEPRAKTPPIVNGAKEDVNGLAEGGLTEGGLPWQTIVGPRNKGTVTRNAGKFDRTPITDIFGGLMRTRIHRDIDDTTDTLLPFFTTQLQIDKTISMKDALDKKMGKDELEGIKDVRTGLDIHAWQQDQIEELPVVMIFHLKIFDFKRTLDTNSKTSSAKILKKVEFPVELKLDAKYLSKNKYNQKQKIYKLFAVVNHDGANHELGHYITDVFHVGYSSWIRYNDNMVHAVPEHHVLHPHHLVTPYLLYYRRSDTIGNGNSNVNQSGNSHHSGGQNNNGQNSQRYQNKSTK